MNDDIKREKVLHGRLWDAAHGGYFSEPAVARPLLETARDLLTRAPAEVVVDLGGGTGFLLSQLAAYGVTAGTILVNVDCSEAQLVLAEEKGMARLQASVGDFRRADIAAPDQRFFYLMRSVLHYSGQDSLSPLLRHLRDQARQGEFFLHQSASFEHEEQAACLNTLYRHMRTHKWYPTVAELHRRLARAGWRVTATTAAPALPLTSEELGRRYALDPGEIRRICDAMTLAFGDREDVFQLTPTGFRAQLHYRIYTCVAGTPQDQ